MGNMGEVGTLQLGLKLKRNEIKIQCGYIYRYPEADSEFNQDLDKTKIETEKKEVQNIKNSI